jgi:hypothetical protein
MTRLFCRSQPIDWSRLPTDPVGLLLPVGTMVIAHHQQPLRGHRRGHGGKEDSNPTHCQVRQRYVLTYVPVALLWWPTFPQQKPASGSMPSSMRLAIPISRCIFDPGDARIDPRWLGHTGRRAQRSARLVSWSVRPIRGCGDRAPVTCRCAAAPAAHWPLPAPTKAADALQ